MDEDVRIRISIKATSSYSVDLFIQMLQQEFQIPYRPLKHLNKLERRILTYINQHVRIANKDHLTRTRHLIHLYQRNPNIHFLLLAHLVSRNTGWHMSDLDNGSVGKLVNEDFRRHILHFLERGNAASFSNVYAQILIYEWSKTSRQSLYHLLPYLQASRFMKAAWRVFLLTGDTHFLTKALIIDEQQHLEQQVMQLPYFKMNIIQSGLFKIQDNLPITDVVIPYRTTNSPSIPVSQRLTGFQVRSLSKINERIKTGLSLYNLLASQYVYQGALKFARLTKHTGSRADYWPEVYETGTPQQSNNYSRSVYSSTFKELSLDLPTYHHVPSLDWCTDSSPIEYLLINTPTTFRDLTHYIYLKVTGMNILTKMIPGSKEGK